MEKNEDENLLDCIFMTADKTLNYKEDRLKLLNNMSDFEIVGGSIRREGEKSIAFVSKQFAREPSIRCIFSLPYISTHIFYEIIDKQRFYKVAPHCRLQPVDKIAFIQAFCNVDSAQYIDIRNRVFARFTCLPYQDDVCELLDVDPSLHKAYIRVVPRIEIKEIGQTTDEPHPFDINVLKRRNLPFEANAKIHFGFDKDMSEFGTRFNDCKFIGKFQILKVKTSYLKIYSKITEEEKAVFGEKLTYTQTKKREDKIKLTFHDKTQIQITQPEGFSLPIVPKPTREALVTPRAPKPPKSPKEQPDKDQAAKEQQKKGAASQPNFNAPMSTRTRRAVREETEVEEKKKESLEKLKKQEEEVNENDDILEPEVKVVKKKIREKTPAEKLKAKAIAANDAATKRDKKLKNAAEAKEVPVEEIKAEIKKEKERETRTKPTNLPVETVKAEEIKKKEVEKASIFEANEGPQAPLKIKMSLSTPPQKEGGQAQKDKEATFKIPMILQAASLKASLKPRLYSLVELPTGEIGVVIAINDPGFNDESKVMFKVIHTTNRVAEYRMTFISKVLSDSNTVRDVQNRRVFPGDIVEVIKGSFKGYKGIVSHTYKNKVFGEFTIDDKEVKPIFVSGREIDTLEDDLGPVII